MWAMFRRTILEWLGPMDLIKVAFLCRLTWYRITNDEYVLNFLNPSKEIQISEWSHLKKVINLFEILCNILNNNPQNHKVTYWLKMASPFD